jgi:mono/diheme cytochrome c family protein
VSVIPGVAGTLGESEIDDFGRIYAENVMGCFFQSTFAPPEYKGPSKSVKREELVMVRVACLVILVTFLAATSEALEIGDADKGVALVRDTCSQCHAIRKGQLLSPNLRAPTFAELAATPGMTSAALAVALTTPHAGMPMFMLSPEEGQDIIAYILSLKFGN